MDLRRESPPPPPVSTVRLPYSILDFLRIFSLTGASTFGTILDVFRSSTDDPLPIGPRMPDCMKNSCADGLSLHGIAGAGSGFRSWEGGLLSLLVLLLLLSLSLRSSN
uniref:(northern house mosquito) hypothetical protein n=1 Tax=Culex pipiens TaxID=7175 RepID=A0A8D8A610_CULPI